MTQSRLPTGPRDTTSVAVVFRGMFEGAVAAPKLLLFLAVAVVLSGGVFFVFVPSFWTLGTLRIVLSLVVASIATGALFGAILPYLRNRLWLLLPVSIIGCGIGGVVFWIVQRPSVGLVTCAICGALVVPAFLLLLGIESLGSKGDSVQEIPPEQDGPPIECPRCAQPTRNHAFCDNCGRDIRKNRPPLVLPDGTVIHDGPNA